MAGDEKRIEHRTRTAVRFHLVTFELIVLRFHLAFDGFSAQLRVFVCLLQPPRVLTDTAKTTELVQFSRERPTAGKFLLIVQLNKRQASAFIFGGIPDDAFGT